MVWLMASMAETEINSQKRRLQQDLFTPIQYIKGVGPDRAKHLEKMQMRRAVDLLFLFPRRYEDFSSVSTPDDVIVDQPTTLVGRVLDVDANYTRTGKRIISALVSILNRSGEESVPYTPLVVTWFNLDYLAKKLAKDQTIVLQGTVKPDDDRFTMNQPKVAWIPADQIPERAKLLPVYPLTEGISQDRMRKIVQQVADDYVHLLDEVLPEEFRDSHQLPGIQEAVLTVHSPDSQEKLDLARRRLIFQELFVQQTALAMRKKYLERSQSATSVELTPIIRSRIENRFPFKLSPSQNQAIDEIASDLQRTFPMNRLLHGEVGSGKTAVAAFAILMCVAQGHQAVMMAPTEILVEQHVKNLKEWLAGSRVDIESWTGAMSDRQRAIAARNIQEGKTGIVVGTNALASAELEFNNLALVVIDEQHKFGVRQRANVRSVDGGDPHYLVMTATPIPRTISMTLYGDLDISTLQSHQEKEQNLNTYFGSESQRDQWWDFFRKKLNEGRQGYVVAPQVDSVSGELATAESLFEMLTNGPLHEFRVDLLHGRLKSEEKLQIMHAFARGNTQVLVATSVVEVGVDVPNATVMTIESAERFGLSQLHQLRGRVGRGRHPGFVCLFPSPQAVLNDPDGDTEKRLQAFVDSTNGFELAEVDLQIRGPGDFFSEKQTGFPPMKIADPARDAELLQQVRQVARDLIDNNESLAGEEWARLRKMVVSRYGHALQLSDVG